MKPTTGARLTNRLRLTPDDAPDRVERLVTTWLGNKELCKGKQSLLDWELIGGGGISSAKISSADVDILEPTPIVLSPESRSSPARVIPIRPAAPASRHLNAPRS
jgi:hypothetical protein